MFYFTSLSGTPLEVQLVSVSLGQQCAHGRFRDTAMHGSDSSVLCDILPAACNLLWPTLQVGDKEALQLQLVA